MAYVIPPLSMNLPPTYTQRMSIKKLSRELAESGNPIPIPHDPANRREARDLIYKLRMERKNAGG